MKKQVKTSKTRIEKWLARVLAQIAFRRLFSLFGVSLLLALSAFHLLFWGRIYPGVSVAGISVGGKTPSMAAEILENSIVLPSQIVLLTAQQKYVLTFDELGIAYDFVSSVKFALAFARSGNLLSDFSNKWQALAGKTNLPLASSLDEEALEEQIATISATLDSLPIEPQVTIQGGKVIVFEGKAGNLVEREKLVSLIKENVAFANAEPLEIPQKHEDPKLTPQEVENLRTRAAKILGKSLTLKIDDESFTYKDNELVPLLDPKGGYLAEKIGELVDSLASVVNHPPQNATFVFEAGRVREFTPAKDGREVKKEELKTNLPAVISSLEEGSDKTASLNILVTRTSPKIKTEDVNNLGIKELIGRGTSRFRGSIANRVHNIALAAAKLSGILIAPGETFSFNNALGDVSVYTGYQQAYVIKDGRTILGDGGGVCQVSTTLFRAALNSGLPIVERHQHSYRVSYYEQDSGPGFDATVYSPSVDLKIKNDTGAYVLIQAKADTKNLTLTFELYGTSDGRVSWTSKPRVWDIVPPPPDLYQDDPTLPTGTIKQVDFKAWGAKAAFDYKVTRFEEILQNRTFYSNYRPWQAIYLRGTGPAQ